jgi:NAD-dependent dihydropyrimidine dehydrogenase PreA subunit
MESVARKSLSLCPAAELPPAVKQPRYEPTRPIVDSPLQSQSGEVETGLVEFLVDERLINGRETMVIDTLRCTRCDDCVRACATFHDGNPTLCTARASIRSVVISARMYAL